MDSQTTSLEQKIDADVIEATTRIKLRDLFPGVGVVTYPRRVKQARRELARSEQPPLVQGTAYLNQRARGRVMCLRYLNLAVYPAAVAAYALTQL